jgi:hypothetical protein
MSIELKAYCLYKQTAITTIATIRGYATNFKVRVKKIFMINPK